MPEKANRNENDPGNFLSTAKLKPVFPYRRFTGGAPKATDDFLLFSSIVRNHRITAGATARKQWWAL